ncbi:50S ribosomal protein L25/general stress protein Ctc [Litoribrevibacter albus]|uniref:Large ribosomal subunit protein bL25 n=1 Tax=Litoribrevibacter albus TaxID=1473156 RepID=A0AA37W9C6_9GAMM|nr:50S ribosomal protein L25/general stress protein Ctc [Litoribrevibacter albus]GLQ32471.1 50S ribosomal protein L25 [Litoribrevibacter albus]
MVDFVLNAEVREDQGKGASRRLRREAGKVPAIVYGGAKNRKPQAITLAANELDKALQSEAFFSHVITLNVADKAEQVIIKDLQRHPAKPVIYHADFLRVTKSTVITKTVPLHFINEETCVGVKQQGGKITHNVADVQIKCTLSNLPEFIEVDMAEVEAGATLHLSDIALPKGVTLVQLALGADHDLAIASIAAKKASADDEAAAE